MELENFISLSLVQIANGIEKANSELNDSTAIVSPKEVTDVPKENKYGNLQLDDKTWVRVQKIDFDVAVTVSEGSELKGGAGISVGAITIGAIDKSDSQNSSLSRIKFSVPMVLPQQEKSA